MEDDREIAAYMFRRTVPSVHLASEDVRLMVGSRSVFLLYWLSLLSVIVRFYHALVKVTMKNQDFMFIFI